MKKCKKLFSLIMAVIMLLAICPVVSFSEDDVLSYLTYKITDGEVTITDCDQSISGDVVIPDTIEGYPVRVIGEYAFSECYSITNITVPDSVVEIGIAAFYHCFCLESIVLPLGITSIKDNTFEDCYSLRKLVVPDNVISIGKSAFRSCFNLENIDFSENLTTIDSYAFALCFNVTNIEFPDSLTTIKDSAFELCGSLESITIPKNITFIDEWTFIGCVNLTDVYIYNDSIELCKYSFENIDMYFKSLDSDEIRTFEEYMEIYSNFMLDYAIKYAAYSRGECMEPNFDSEFDAVWGNFEKDATNTIKYFAIHANTGSTAEAYALENGFEFVELCEHNYISGVIKEPTVTEVGIKADVCKHCGDIINAEEIPMLEKDEDVTDDSPSQDNSSQSFIEIIIQFFQKIIEFIKNLFKR